RGHSEIIVVDRASHGLRVEEAKGLAVAENLLVRLGDRGEVDSGPLRRRVRGHVLLGENRLARPRQPDEHRDRVRREAAAEHGVEARMSARETLAHRDAVASLKKALFPSRSFTTDTNCRGSSGFWR